LGAQVYSARVLVIAVYGGNTFALSIVLIVAEALRITGVQCAKIVVVAICGQVAILPAVNDWGAHTSGNCAGIRLGAFIPIVACLQAWNIDATLLGFAGIQRAIVFVVAIHNARPRPPCELFRCQA